MRSREEQNYHLQCVNLMLWSLGNGVYKHWKLSFVSLQSFSFQNISKYTSKIEKSYYNPWHVLQIWVLCPVQKTFFYMGFPWFGWQNLKLENGFPK